jgi:CBS domain-containing protein
MEEAKVGALIVLDAERRPVGILTDRDVTVRCVARERDPRETTIASLMTKPVVGVPEETPIEDALRQMTRSGVRRLAVTDARGRLAGLLALDDVLELLSEEAVTIGRLLARPRAASA